MNTTYAWAPITKVEDQDDGTILVHGAATDTTLDRDQQRMDQAWLDKAMPKWMAEGGNIREQHDPRRAVGVGVGLHKDDGTGAWMLTSRVVDPVAVMKVKTGVLKGYSIGVKDPHITFGKAEAPNGLIDGGDVCETSLADRPSNPASYFTLAKADAAGDLVVVENPVLVEPSAIDRLVALLPDLTAHFQNGAPVTAPQPPTEPASTEVVPAAVVEPEPTPVVSAPAAAEKSDVADIVKAAVAEAVKPLEDQLVLVKAELAKVAAMPEPGGPVAMRTASQTAAARGADAASLRAQAADLLAKADAVRREDPTLSQGYRERATDLLAKADA